MDEAGELKAGVRERVEKELIDAMGKQRPV
jgi:hypothetical protein